MHISHLAAALSIAASQGAPTAQEVLDAQDGCYDVALVGHMIDTHGFQSLNDLLPRHDGSLWWGGIASVLFRKKAQVVGISPQLGWVKVNLSAVYLPTARILLLAKNHPSGVPIGVYFTGIKKGDSPRQVAKALAEAKVERCH